MPIYTYITLPLTMLLWGETFISGRMLAETVVPAGTAFLRFTIASFALLLIARLMTGGLQRLRRKHWVPLILLDATGVFSYNLCFFIGLKHISAGRPPFLLPAHLSLSRCCPCSFIEIGYRCLVLAGSCCLLQGLCS